MSLYQQTMQKAYDKAYENIAPSMAEEIFKVSSKTLIHETDYDTPVHRHIVVFSFRVLRSYLHMIGFSNVTGYGFGLYPFPNFMQPMLERLDPFHCHQMVFVETKQRK